MALVFRRLATAEGRADYADRAIIEFTAATYHCEEAGHGRYCATSLNNLAMLLYQLERYAEAHEHLNRAHTFLERLKDVGLLAQVEETRARVYVAEQHYHAARRAIIGVVETFEKGGESALLSDALIIKGTVQARLGDNEESLRTFRHAIRIAKEAGALSNAGHAAVSMIEEHSKRLSDAELFRLYQRADQFLSTTQDAEDIARLRACALLVIRKLYGSELDEYFTLPEVVLAYEARFVELALVEEGGSITRAASRLGISHQTLSFMLQSRHKKLRSKRKPEIKRKSIIRKGK
jgi:tetratricopeptide (TPR) repeat protein